MGSLRSELAAIIGTPGEPPQQRRRKREAVGRRAAEFTCRCPPNTQAPSPRLLHDGPRLLACHDLAGGYHEDRWVQVPQLPLGHRGVGSKRRRSGRHVGMSRACVVRTVRHMPCHATLCCTGLPAGGCGRRGFVTSGILPAPLARPGCVCVLQVRSLFSLNSLAAAH